MELIIKKDIISMLLTESYGEGVNQVVGKWLSFFSLWVYVEIELLFLYLIITLLLFLFLSHSLSLSSYNTKLLVGIRLFYLWVYIEFIYLFLSLFIYIYILGETLTAIRTGKNNLKLFVTYYIIFWNCYYIYSIIIPII